MYRMIFTSYFKAFAYFEQFSRIDTYRRKETSALLLFNSIPKGGLFVLHMVNVLLDLASKLGYPGILVIVGLEYACFPIPSEIVLTFVGMGIAKGTYTLPLAIVGSFLGGIIGSLICYAIGFWGGTAFIEWSKKKFPKTQKTIHALREWFDAYGNVAVLLTRIIPLTRTYVSFLAGSQKLPLSVFILYSGVGIFIWNSLLIGLGYFVGDNLALLDTLFRRYQVASMIAFVLIVFVLLRRRKRAF
jgi:membrane protein DedA with SNARE-associated domain